MTTDNAPEFDLGPLSWVHGEIDQALSRGLESLATFKAAPKDAIALKHARTHIHQAAGAIQMVGLDAVVAFTDEIERQLTRLESAAADQVGPTVDAIDRGCRKLKIFLDELTNGAMPVPLKLYPEYEAMQALRGVTASAPTDLFYPDLAARAPRPAPREALPAARLASQLVKQRRVYQRGLLAWLRGDDQGVAAMREAIAGIEDVTSQPPLRAFWWTAGALFESLAAKGLEPSFGVKQLAARIDLQIRRVVGGSAKVADRLRREVLYFVAISAPSGAQVQAVQKTFHLAGLIPSEEVLNADLVRIEPLLREAREQLAGAKDAWLKFASGRAENLPRLKQMLTSVHAKTAEIRNGTLMKLTSALVERLDKMPSAGVSEPVAMEMATALLLAESAFENYSNLAPDFPQQVDAMIARLDAARAGRSASSGAPALDEMSRRAQERMLLAQVGREIQANLRHMEQVLDAFFRDNSKRGELASLAKDSQQIRGALSMLGLDEASKLLASCQQQIEGYAASEGPVDNDELEMLAESLSGLGFYIEAVEQQRPDCERLIAPLIAKRSGAVVAPLRDDDAESVESAVERLRAQLPALVEEARHASMHSAARQGLKSKLESLRDDAELIGDATLAQQAESAIAELDAGGAAGLARVVDEIAVTTPAAPEISDETRRLLENDASELDGELLEIFLTEAAEVVDAIGASHASLVANHADHDALVNARRGFHTLKGSGRMVGLTDLGDLAWQVEKTMNRVLDEERAVTPAVLDMIDVAGRSFRGWIDSLQRTRRVTLDSTALHAAVDAVVAELPSQGGSFAPPPAPPRLVEVAPRGAMAAAAPAPAIANPLALEELIELPELGAPPGAAPQVVVRDAARSEPATLELVPQAGDALTIGAIDPVDLSPPGLKLVADNTQPSARTGHDLPFEDGPGAGHEQLHDAPGPAHDHLRVASGPDNDHLHVASVSDHELEASLERDLDAHLERDDEAITLLPLDEAPAAFDAHDEPQPFDFDAAANAGFDDAVVTPIAPAVDPELDAALAHEARLAREASTPESPAHAAAGDDELVTVGEVTLSAALLRILVDEADEHVATLQHELSLLQFDPARTPSQAMVRASHTLCGIHRTGGFPPVATLAKSLEQALLALAEREGAMPSQSHPVIARAIAALTELVAAIRRRERFAEGLEREAADCTAELDALRQEVAADGSDAESLAARIADEEPGEGAGEGQGAAERQDAAAAATASASSATAAALATPLPGDAPHADAAGNDDASPASAPASAPKPAEPLPGVARAEAPRVADDQVSLADIRDAIEGDVLPIFLEEAAELFPQAGEELRGWRRNPASPGAQALRRTLHTFKGSARMAGAMRLGELAHRMESRLVEGDALVAPSPELFEALDTDLDHIAYVLDKLRTGASNIPLPWLEDADAVVHEPVASPEPPADEAAVGPRFRGDDAAQPGDGAKPGAPRAVVVPLTPERAGEAATHAATQQPQPMPAAPAEREAAVASAEPEAGRAMLRVRADTIDRLVNEAGEVAIARARVEGELRTLKANLLELTGSVIRLRTQVREIEIQAESQIQSRMSAMSEAHEGFDPLEFDRYTRFQELTRSLAEGVNDVSTVQQSLLKNLDDADAALVAQARMSRDVSQQLFAIRTVPFGSVSDRLYRILRATARELDKRANLEIRGSQVELDRSVLEKLIGPLEHLLRNALDHGIESRAARVAAGKSETGELSLTVRQVGNEVLIELADDGAGLDLARIAEKARAQNLFPEGTEPTPAQLVECIFKPGFSTASKVTQISGRGVGMDVVRTEINALGGRVDVATRSGAGTTFAILMPLTLAVAQAVLVRAGGRLWALPAPMVEQVQQVRGDALLNLYVSRNVSWQGRDYPFHYLPRLLGDTTHNPETQRYNAVLLVKSGQSQAAVHVDEMVGNQEIVVKNIGPQLARVSGISGATVLGTGEIVLIINPVQLAQRAGIDLAEPPLPGVGGTPVPAAAAKASQQPRVLIVDDSLTVRKITSRLLQREGYVVATAKDGMDALQAIAEAAPDVILLDIEMPRMDGFEFTKTLKAEAAHAHIPIIMITSRTADKHRNRADELGVDVYLGKPYQEDELLRHIRALTREAAVH